MSYLVIDLETTSKTVKKRKGNFMYNTILCSGYKYQELDKPKSSKKDYLPAENLKGVDLLIGHNIKYDLLYIWRNEEVSLYFKNGGQIWDTQLTEYILSGQLHKYPSLRDIAVNKYGCEYRDKNLEAYKVGRELDTTLVPIEELLEDVKGDVLDTEKVALAQVRLAREDAMLPLIKAQMDSILATTEMEFNGMYIDINVLDRNKEKYLEEIKESNETVDKIAKEYGIDRFNPKSPAQVSTLFFGGKIKTTIREQIGVFKSGKNKGQPKYSNTLVITDIQGLGLKPHSSWKGTKEGQYSTSEKVLKIIATRGNKLAVAMLTSRKLNKLVDAYYVTTRECITEHDSCVHPEFSHCGYEKKETDEDEEDSVGGGTPTARTSCRHPNVQQVPKKGLVKYHFVSRYGKQGAILNFDYKQIEVVVFAFLTQDVQLLEDLRNGVDIHRTMYANCYGVNLEDVTDEQRTGIKACTFHVIYGGSYKSMAKRVNLDEEFCKKFIQRFYERYPMAKVWQDNLVHEVEASAERTTESTPKGFAVDRGCFRSITGRRYEFRTKDSPEFMVDRGIMTSFNPPDIKNYPVQGLATGDIVLIMLGRLWRKIIHHRDKFLLINTVHDSIMIDCKLENLDFCVRLVKKELESVPEMMKEVFKIDFNLDVKVDYSYGQSWGDC